MGLSIYGFSPAAHASGNYLPGPRASYQEANDFQATTVIATMLYILTAKRPDHFLLGSDGTSEGEPQYSEIVNYCLFSCGLADADDDESLEWCWHTPAERKACATFLWDLYATGNLDWYEYPVEHHPIQTPLLAGLHTFLDRPTEDGVWSIGQTADIEILFDTLFGFFSRENSQHAAKLAAELEPYRDAFKKFREAGAYGIRV